MAQIPRWVLAVCSGLLTVLITMPVLAQGDQYQGEVVGKVKNISADQHRLTVRDTDNRDWTFTLNDATKVRDGSQEAKLDNLKVGDRVDVVYRMNGYVPKTIQKLR